MEQVPDPNSLTREALVSLNDRSTDLEDVRAMFNVDLEYLKARLLQENIYVWESSNFGRVRIHMGDSYAIHLCFKKLRLAFDVRSTQPLKHVISIIEIETDLSPGYYKLTCKHPSEKRDVLLQTDRDWHFAVELFRGKDLLMYLDLKPSVSTSAIYLSYNWKQVPVSSKQPTKDSKPELMGPNYIRRQRELILKLNNGLHTFEDARSSINVDLDDFKKVLFQENIFVWNDKQDGPVRIHGGDYVIHIFIKKLRKSFKVGSTVSFKEVIRMIERDLKLSPGSYKLTYKHPCGNRNAVIKTDRDWHYAVEFSGKTGFKMCLDLKINKKCKKSN